MSKPIRPQDVGAAKTECIPAAVFDAFNAEISARFSGRSATVMQEAVVARLVDGGMKRSEIFAAGWLNVEEEYNASGWKVRYEKPGFNESGSAYFEFVAAPGEPDDAR
jgi:hypothetical protein